MRRSHVERALEAVPDFDAPDAAKEQYRTPPAVAAQFLWLAAEEGDIRGKRVLDLGCGTGMLAKGAAVLGAAEVFGVDVDAAAVAVARTSVPTGTFAVADVAAWLPPAVDTVLMNPPFGAQRKGADRVFYQRAAEAVAAAGGAVWFLQQPSNERFLTAFFAELGLRVERAHVWDYPLEQRFAFHHHGVATVPVGLYVARPTRAGAA